MRNSKVYLVGVISFALFSLVVSESLDPTCVIEKSKEMKRVDPNSAQSPKPSNREINHEVPHGPNPIGNPAYYGSNREIKHEPNPIMPSSKKNDFNREIKHEVPHGPNPIGN